MIAAAGTTAAPDIERFVAPVPPYRLLELEVEVDTDPVRQARIVSAQVNNSVLSLAEARVGRTLVYPVAEPGDALGRSMTLTLRPRNQSESLDRLLQEELTTIVSRCAQVLNARRIP